MSQENVDVVRQAREAFARRDNNSVFLLYDPEVEVLSEVDGRTYHGLAGVREFTRDWLSAWDEWGNEVVEWIDVGGNDVSAVMRERARAKRSGVPVARTNAHRWTLRNGKLWRLRVYATKAEALEAVGLSE